MNTRKLENILHNNKELNIYYKNITNYICDCYFHKENIVMNVLKKKIYKLLYKCNEYYIKSHKNEIKFNNNANNANNDNNNNEPIFETLYDKQMFLIDIKVYLIKNFIDYNLDNVILNMINNTYFFDNFIADFYAYLLCTKLWNNESKLVDYIYNIEIEQFANLMDYFSKFIHICSAYNKNYIIIKLISHPVIKDLINNDKDVIIYIFYMLLNNYIFNKLFDKDVLFDFFNIYKQILISLIDNDFIYTYMYILFNNISNYHQNEEITKKNLLRNSAYNDIKLLLIIDKFYFRNICTNIETYIKYITIDYIDNVYENFYKIFTWLLIDNKEFINIQLNNKLLFNILYINYSEKNINFFYKLFEDYRYTTKLEKNIYYYTKFINIYSENDKGFKAMNKNNYIKLLLLWNYLSCGVNLQNYKIFYECVCNINNKKFYNTFKNIFKSGFINIKKNINIFYYLQKEKYNELYKLLDLYNNDCKNIYNDECPISFDKCNMITNCSHTFNFNSFIEWYKQNKNCPCCRQYIKLNECKKIK